MWFYISFNSTGVLIFHSKGQLILTYAFFPPFFCILVIIHSSVLELLSKHNSLLIVKYNTKWKSLQHSNKSNLETEEESFQRADFSGLNVCLKYMPYTLILISVIYLT